MTTKVRKLAIHAQMVATENFDDVGCVFCDIVALLRASDLAAPRGWSLMVRSSPKFVSANVIHVTGKTRARFRREIMRGERSIS